MPLSEMPPALGPDAGAEPPLVRVRPPGPMSRSWFGRLSRVESPAVGARREARAEASGAEMAPIVYASATGANVVDVDGNRYVDLAAGFGALLLGHGPARVARALAVQADRLWLALGDLYPADAKVALLERIAAIYPAHGARVMLGQSGSDAVTMALKTAVLATGRPGVVAFAGAYHGLSYAPLALCGLRASWRVPFAAQLNAHAAFAPYPRTDADLDRALGAVRAALARGDVGAVVVEPLLGRGGCVVPPAAFLPELVKLAHEAGALLVADEVWTGLGRAGAMLASVAAGAVPDLVCLGKGLGGGLPISACVGSDDVMRAWRRPTEEEVIDTTTHAGSPLACAAAIATLDALRAGKLVERSAEVGRTLRTSLLGALAGSPAQPEVRGAGLMVGVALRGGGEALAAKRALLEAGYIVTSGGVDSEVVIATPPLTIGEDLLDGFVDALAAALGGPATEAPG